MEEIPETRDNLTSDTEAGAKKFHRFLLLLLLFLLLLHSLFVVGCYTFQMVLK